jgi:hypothetical protein
MDTVVLLLPELLDPLRVFGASGAVGRFTLSASGEQSPLDSFLRHEIGTGAVQPNACLLTDREVRK